MSSLAVLATIPGRGDALERCLASLRPQVDQLRVICHDMETPPDCVARMADEYICHADERGSAAKLYWAASWEGLYLGCDDDLLYPPDYVEVMTRWVKRWKGKALVTSHGRILKRGSKTFDNVRAAWPPRGSNPGAWINYPGGCAMAFDTRLNVPSVVPGKNLEEAHLAVWAQRNRIPIWLVPHTADWLRYLLDEKANLPTIWASEKKAGFANRNAVLGQVSRWEVFQC